MKLFEIAEPSPVVSPQGFDIVIGQIYIFTPVSIKDKRGELHSLFTTYSPEAEEIRLFSIVGTDPIVFKVIRAERTFEESNIIRVQILSDVDNQVEKYDGEKEELILDQNGNTIPLKIKQIPTFTNLDMISDETFEETFGRRRKPYEHGLVGYIYLDQEPSLASDFNQTSIGGDDSLSVGYNAEQQLLKDRMRGHSGGYGATGAGAKRHHNAQIKQYNKQTEQGHHELSKMQQAIAIYKANIALPRVRVIKMLMTYLDMTRAGASSYYTKAMHAVEDDKKE